MSGKSIAGKALAFRQRHNHIKAEGAYKKDEDGNVIDKVGISTKKTICRNCSAERWFTFVRCPECSQMQ